MNVRVLLAIGLLAAVLPAGLEAQRANQPPRRAQLEAQVGREFARAIRNRVGLSDAQMARLGPITQKYAGERRTLQMEERDSRMALQRSLRDSTAADSANVSRLLQRLIDVQKRRVQVLEAEQRDLAGIMSPIQRARFMAMQEQLRRQMEQRRGRRQGDPAPR
jgi:hypothetical protein